MLARLLVGAAALGLLAAALGCAARREPETRRLSLLRPATPAIETVNLVLDRQEMISALAREHQVARLRLVEIFSSVLPDSFGFPQYRVFGVERESIYYLMGLRNADIVLAANDRILVNGNLFKEYVRLLPGESEAQVQIRRGEKEILFKYKMMDAAGSESRFNSE